MAWVRSFKMPFQTNHFNLNEKVFVVYGTGDMAALCYGRWRGKHRYVKAWVRWSGKSKTVPEIKEFEIDDKSEIAQICGSPVPFFSTDAAAPPA